jgi:hypothetical protein
VSSRGASCHRRSSQRAASAGWPSRSDHAGQAVGGRRVRLLVVHEREIAGERVARLGELAGALGGRGEALEDDRVGREARCSGPQDGKRALGVTGEQQRPPVQAHGVARGGAARERRARDLEGLGKGGRVALLREPQPRGRQCGIGRLVIGLSFDRAGENLHGCLHAASLGVRRAKREQARRVVGLELGQRLELREPVAVATQPLEQVGERLAGAHGTRGERHGALEGPERLGRVSLLPQRHAEQIVRLGERVVLLHREAQRAHGAGDVAGPVAGERQLVQQPG